jgi:hypothetical protein
MTEVYPTYWFVRWQPIRGFERFYEVSEYGEVRRTQNRRWRKKGTAVTQNRDRFGYRRVQLYDSKTRQRHTFAVHRLVMQAFVGDCPDGHEVNHKDGDKANNHLSNLEYVTHRENIQHSFKKLNRTQRVPRGEQSGVAKLTAAQVLEIRARAANGERRMALGTEFGVTSTCITSIVRRVTWKHI